MCVSCFQLFVSGRAEGKKLIGTPFLKTTIAQATIHFAAQKESFVVDIGDGAWLVDLEFGHLTGGHFIQLRDP